MNKNRLFISAINIHQGGGLTILKSLLDELKFRKNTYIYLDKRACINIDSPSNLNIVFIKNSFLTRFFHEIKLRLLLRSEDLLIRLGNLPPVFPLKSKVIVFIQNRYLVDSKSLAGFDFLVRLRIGVERYWFKIFSRNVDEYIVQTPTMKKLLIEKIGKSKKVYEIALIGKISPLDKINERMKSLVFIYPASGEPHKNHRNLILAWCELSNKNIFPPLVITLCPVKFSNLCNWINNLVEIYKLNVTNVGLVAQDKMHDLYKNSTVLIYPSNFESFGLPLVEAKALGLKILASELDYVRDLIDPDEVFDPNSSISIARSVSRFLGVPEIKVSLKNASEFLRALEIDL